MKNVCVITGGGSGMGLAAAKYLPKDKIVILSGRTLKKLENAVAELTALGYEAYAHACDTSERTSVRDLAEYAASRGEIKNVINAAGLSPAMAKPEQLLRVNALGTMYVNQEFAKLMNAGSVIVDVSSNSAYVLPSFLVSKRTYQLAEMDEELFLKKLMRISSLPKGAYQKSGFAYALSKNFVVWYAAKCAFSYGKKGIRVVSLSPGLIATDMGNLEVAEGGGLIRYTAEDRMGTPEELGFALAMAADERNGYLAGVDTATEAARTVRGSLDGMSNNKILFKKRKNLMMNKTIYLVTGAAGFLGSHVCDELLARGERVRALVLPGDKSVKYVPKAVEIVEGNLCDENSLETFFTVLAGTDSIVIHCASMVTTNAEFNQKLIDVNVGGTKNIIEKCLAHPECRRMVYVSSTGAIPEQPKGTAIKEAERFVPINEKTQVGCYSQSKAMATQEVLDACRTRGLQACVVHPSGILGPKDYAVGETTGTIIKIMNGEMPVGMGGSFNLCDVRDLAQGCVSAADKGRVGECYILGNKEVTLKEVCRMLHEESGCKMPHFYVPIKMAYLLAAQMEKKAQKTGEKPLMTNFAVYNLARNNQFDYSKAERELGYHTRPYAETLHDEARWLMDEGYIKGKEPKKTAVHGKGFIEAVAAASSKEELRRLLGESGVCRFSDEQLEESYRSLALSQNWNAVRELFDDKDFESCSRKLAAYGITTTRENFDLISEVIATASDDALIAEITKTRAIEDTLETLHRHGYHTMTAEFLLLVREEAQHLYQELLSKEEIADLSGQSFYERCQKSINLIFALSSIAGLTMGVSTVTDPALLIAITGGVSLMFGEITP